MSETDNVFRHGGAYDRGAADSYYRRGENPHYYEGNPDSVLFGKRIELTNPNSYLYQAYMKGYQCNERDRNFKNWGYSYEN